MCTTSVFTDTSVLQERSQWTQRAQWTPVICCSVSWNLTEVIVCNFSKGKLSIQSWRLIDSKEREVE